MVITGSSKMHYFALYHINIINNSNINKNVFMLPPWEKLELLDGIHITLLKKKNSLDNKLLGLKIRIYNEKYSCVNEFF